MIGHLGNAFVDAPVLALADSLFGNNGLFRPLRADWDERVDLLSRWCVNSALYAIPEPAPARLALNCSVMALKDNAELDA